MARNLEAGEIEHPDCKSPFVAFGPSSQHAPTGRVWIAVSARNAAALTPGRQAKRRLALGRKRASGNAGPSLLT
jgi:hypothetical protein